MDREGKDVLSLLQDIEKTLALDTTPASWPVGMGREFKGCFDLFHNQLALFHKGDKEAYETIQGLENVSSILGDITTQNLQEEIEMVQALCPAFNEKDFLQGTLTPVFFGSAIHNFGVKELLEALCQFAPAPRSQKATERTVLPDEEKVTGFIFKIQANMDAKHRDRIAFVRLCSGHFKKGMKLLQVRTKKQLILHNPVHFLAQERVLIEDAFAGDIVGLPNHGGFQIGDTLTEGEQLHFKGIPSFAPELLQKVRSKDPLKSKHLNKALEQIAEEGGASIFKPVIGNEYIVGVVGQLQFEVLADRIRTEFEIPVVFEPTIYYTARWVKGEADILKKFIDTNQSSLAYDYKQNPVFMARNAWHISKVQEDFPQLQFLTVNQ